MDKISLKKQYKDLRDYADYAVKERILILGRPAHIETPKFELLPQRHNVIETINKLYDFIEKREKETIVDNIEVRLETSLKDTTMVDITTTAIIREV